MPNVINERMFAVAPQGASAPDSLTMSNSSLWVVWGNGASSTAYPGTNGSSTVVECNTLGAVENTCTLGGHVDGLKLDPSTGDIWALQNEDANSTLTLIDPATNQVSPMLQWGSGYTYGANSARGFDDVVFDGRKVFASQTNPNPGDPVISEVLNGNAPFGTLETQSILLGALAGCPQGPAPGRVDFSSVRIGMPDLQLQGLVEHIREFPRSALIAAKVASAVTSSSTARSLTTS